MARRTKKVASRGSVNNIILESLLSGDKYGYEIIKEVEDKTDGKVKLKQPSLYSSLKRFETKKYITSYWGDSEIGGRRHYYSITDAGRKYYADKKSNSLFDDEDDEEIVSVQPEEQVETTETSYTPYELDTHEDSTSYINKNLYNFSVEDKLNSLLNDDSTIAEEVSSSEIDEQVNENDNEEDLQVLYDAIEEERKISNPVEEPEQTNDEEFIPDHVFHEITPLDVASSKVENETPQENTTEQIDQQPEKDKPEIVTDEFGITKLKSDLPPKPVQTQIIDNVNGRIHYKDLVDKTNTPTPPAPEPAKTYDQLSDEERTKRSENFVKKFNEISQDRYTSSDDISYKNILGELFVEEQDSEQPQEQPNEEQQDIFDSLNVEPVKDTTTTGNFSGSLTLDKYTKDIEEEGFNVKVYNKNSTQSYKSQYLLINKLKFAFGLIMALLMIVQVTVILISLKCQNLFFADQTWVYVCGYLTAVIVGLIYCIPLFISPKAQQTKTIKFNYTILFGTLAFFVTLLLTYAINTFIGLDFTNTSHYLSTMLVPTILATNFIVGPLVFRLLSKNNNFY